MRSALLEQDAALHAAIADALAGLPHSPRSTPPNAGSTQAVAVAAVAREEGAEETLQERQEKLGAGRGSHPPSRLSAGSSPTLGTCSPSVGSGAGRAARALPGRQHRARGNELAAERVRRDRVATLLPIALVSILTLGFALCDVGGLRAPGARCAGAAGLSRTFSSRRSRSPAPSPRPTASSRATSNGSQATPHAVIDPQPEQLRRSPRGRHARSRPAAPTEAAFKALRPTQPRDPASPARITVPRPRTRC